MEQLTLDHVQLVVEITLILFLTVSWFWFQSAFARQREDIQDAMNVMRDEIIASIDSKNFVTMDDCRAAHAGVAHVEERVGKLEQRITRLEENN